MNIKLFDYHLPQELIAQEQIKPRDHSRLLILDRESKKVEHKKFYDLVDYLNQDDVLVLNETKVFPARLIGQKQTGGKVEVFLINSGPSTSLGVLRQCMIGGKIKLNNKILFNNLECEVIKDLGDKLWEIKFNKSGQDLEDLIEQIGQTPLPPYIKTQDSDKIKQDYQTIFARSKGSVAAPTAGLHFTPELFKKLEAKKIKIFKIILHVSLGTFAPVDVEDITKYKIHSEWASIDKDTAQELNKLKQQNKNIIAIGTTSARTLEAFADESGKLSSGNKNIDIYIYPGYKYKFIDDMISNFHLPKSSLLFMISALAGRELILDTYQKAIDMKYRFFSFGDAMFITKNRL